jgi:hypothetical protein
MNKDQRLKKKEKRKKSAALQVGMTKMAKYCSSRDREFISPKAKIKD